MSASESEIVRRGDRLTTPVRVRVAVLLVVIIIVALASLAMFFKWQLDRQSDEANARANYLACVSKLPITTFETLDEIVLQSIVNRNGNVGRYQDQLERAIKALKDINTECPPPSNQN